MATFVFENLIFQFNLSLINKLQLKTNFSCVIPLLQAGKLKECNKTFNGYDCNINRKRKYYHLLYLKNSKNTNNKYENTVEIQ